MIKYYVTHPGRAHNDDFLALCFCLGHSKQQPDQKEHPPIYRRNPTAEELNDPDVWVIDIGGIYDDNLHNYDHHQLPKGDTTCSITLILKKFGLYRPDQQPWIKSFEILDTQGPCKLAEYYEMSVENLHATRSPITRAILNLFECKKEIHHQDLIYTTMETIGERSIHHIQLDGPTSTMRWG